MFIGRERLINRLTPFILLLLILAGEGVGLAADNQKAPAFTLPDFDGNLVSSDSFIGKKPVLIMFWATW